MVLIFVSPLLLVLLNALFLEDELGFFLAFVLEELWRQRERLWRLG